MDEMPTTPAPNSTLPPAAPRKKPSLTPLLILLLVFGTGLYLYNRESLRRSLSDDDVAAYLGPKASGRDVYHAVEELSRRIQAHDPSAARFYPAVIALTKSDDVERRKAAAWVMGEDNQNDSFRQALLPLLADPAPLVARNAALSLARHGSAAAREVLLSMLRPFDLRSTEAGTFTPKVQVGDTVDRGHQVGTLKQPDGSTYVVESPLVGQVAKIAAPNATIEKGGLILTLAAAQSHAADALVALMFPGVGQPEDAAAIEAFVAGAKDLEGRVQEQAKHAISELRARAKK